jgi:hypothetical protein
MKKIIFVLTLMVAIALISGNERSEKNEIPEKIAKQVIPIDYIGLSKTDLHEAKTSRDSFSQERVSAGLPGILLLLTNDKGKATKSPSFWWNYLIAKPGQTGC